MNPKIEIYAHRGGAGLWPEMSLRAYENAIKLGVDVLDMDVGVTKDNIVVAYHDRTLNRAYTRYQDGRSLPRKPLFIKNFTFEELQQFDIGILDKTSPYGKNFPDQQAIPGQHILSLKQILQYGKKIGNHTLRFQIEIKSDPRYPNTTVSAEKFAELIAELIDSENLYTRVEVHSFDWRNLLALQKIDTRICTSFITSQSSSKIFLLSSPLSYGQWFAGYKIKEYGYSWPKLIASLHGKIWCPDFKDVNIKNVKEAHAHGLKIVPWTVDSNEDLNHMIELQVDGIITNRPDRLNDKLQSY